ncbi:MAG TPA: energy-coupling factor transporter ATPase [Bacilli bacterium]|nr:energy-coupling factor transporter ATPase [Bacilli bacterium]
MNNNALIIKNLFYSYDNEKDVVNDVSLSIKRGSYVSVIGHNGSGKSTFAKLIAGLLEAQSGEIYIFDQRLNEQNLANIRMDLGIVFQNPDNQFIGSTVRDDIAFGLENRQVPSAKMDEIIERFAGEVGMSEFLDKEPTNLSGGQKQRVAIAGVLALNPKMIILDEATAMLDPRGKREIGEIVKGMKRDNPDLTVISITHDIEETLASDEIIVFSEGQIILQGRPEEVYQHAETLHSISLDLPFIYRLKEALAKQGLEVKSHDLDGLAGELWQ